MTHLSEVVEHGSEKVDEGPEETSVADLDYGGHFVRHI